MRTIPAALVPALLALLALLAMCALAPAQEVVYRFWTRADLVDLAAIHASKYPGDRARYLRYVDLAAVAPKDRPARLQALGYVVNCWSRSDLIAPVKAVPGTELALAYFDVSQLRERDDQKGVEQLIAALDRLGELGSGPAPRPEPFYHAVTVGVARDTTEDYYEDEKSWERRHDGHGYYHVEVSRRVKKTRTVAGAPAKKVALGTHLNRATAIGLATLTDTAFFIFEYHWLVSRGLDEPRYHELLGLDDSLEAARKLAAVDLKLSDRVGSQVRGVVLLSEVAEHNRALERTPSQHRYGRGSYWESLDFLRSDGADDVLKDLLADRPAAREVIWTLPNGLQGYLVVNGKNRRLDKADPDVAVSRRLKFRNPQVRNGYVCMSCHLAESGWIDIDDELRHLATKPVKLLADRIARDDRRRGERIRQKYLGDQINDLIAADRLVVEQAVRRSTGGLTSAAVAKIVIGDIATYLDRPVTLARLAAEVGYPQEDVLAALQTPGLDPVFVVMRGGRSGRRDQVEAGFAQVATVLHQKPRKEKE